MERAFLARTKAKKNNQIKSSTGDLPCCIKDLEMICKAHYLSDTNDIE